MQAYCKVKGKTDDCYRDAVAARARLLKAEVRLMLLPSEEISTSSEVESNDSTTPEIDSSADEADSFDEFESYDSLDPSTLPSDLADNFLNCIASSP